MLGKKPKVQVREWQDWQPKDFKPTHCTDLIKLMAAGKGIQAFNSDNNISRSQFYKWLGLYPDFKLAHEIGKEKSKGYLIGLLHDNIYDTYDPDSPSEKLNMTVWNAIMKHQHQIPEAREAQERLSEATESPRTMMTSVLDGLREGIYDLDQATEMAGIIETAQRIGENSELVKRIEELERSLESGAKADEFKEE